MPVLDTSFVIDLLAGDPDAASLMRLLQQGTAPIGVTVYTHFELYAGVGRSKRAKEETGKVEGLLREMTVFEMTPEAAKLAGLLDAQLAAEGRSVGIVDLLIGATALHHGESIVTRNRRHFEGIPGLEIVGY